MIEGMKLVFERMKVSETKVSSENIAWRLDLLNNIQKCRLELNNIYRCVQTFPCFLYLQRIFYFLGFCYDFTGSEGMQDFKYLSPLGRAKGGCICYGCMWLRCSSLNRSSYKPEVGKTWFPTDTDIHDIWDRRNIPYPGEYLGEINSAATAEIWTQTLEGTVNTGPLRHPLANVFKMRVMYDFGPSFWRASNVTSLQKGEQITIFQLPSNNPDVNYRPDLGVTNS